MRTIEKIITKVDCTFGAPMGRNNVAPTNPPFPFLERVFDCKVPLIDGYDKGGAYWGFPNNLRVSYTKNLSYIKFYRK